MEKIQFKAGYLVDSIAKIIDEYKNSNSENEQNKINGLLQYVSSFDVQFPEKHELDFKNLNPVLATINNIITRGLPTKAPLFIEEKFVDMGLIEKNTKDYEFSFPLFKNETKDTFKENYKDWYNTIFELLHILKPELDINFENYAGLPEGGVKYSPFFDQKN